MRASRRYPCLHAGVPRVRGFYALREASRRAAEKMGRKSAQNAPPMPAVAPTGPGDARSIV